MRKLMLAVVSLFTVMSLSANAATLDDHLSSLHTMRADFTQTVYDKNNKPLQKSYGHMALERPGKFRWEVTRPNPQLIVANNTKLWVYDPDLEQVTIRVLHQAAGESPALLLSHENATIDKDYKVTMINKKQLGMEWYALAPRGDDSMLSSVELGFKNNQLSEMQLQDHLGHTTRIQFQRTETNASLPAALFTFKKPANVDVIDETKRG